MWGAQNVLLRNGYSRFMIHHSKGRRSRGACSFPPSPIGGSPDVEVCSLPIRKVWLSCWSRCAPQSQHPVWSLPFSTPYRTVEGTSSGSAFTCGTHLGSDLSIVPFFSTPCAQHLLKLSTELEAIVWLPVFNGAHGFGPTSQMNSIGLGSRLDQALCHLHLAGNQALGATHQPYLAPPTHWKQTPHAQSSVQSHGLWGSL